MKHTDYFDTFLTNTVNLSELKLDQLEARVENIYTVSEGRRRVRTGDC